jgi:hypothetical protein
MSCLNADHLQLSSCNAKSRSVISSATYCPGPGHVQSDSAVHLVLLKILSVSPITCSNSSSSALDPFSSASAIVLKCPNSAGGT